MVFSSQMGKPQSLGLLLLDLKEEEPDEPPQLAPPLNTFSICLFKIIVNIFCNIYEK